MTAPTEPRSDRFLKRVWLVNGLVLLALLLFGLGAFLFEWLGDWRGHGTNAVAAPPADATGDGPARVRAVRFDVPTRIRGTDVRLVLVRNGAGFLPDQAPRVSQDLYDASNRRAGPIVNVIFLAPTGASGHLLFDRPAFISQVRFPGGPYGGADSTQTWITYEVALEDVNGDGNLDEEDSRDLFVSDLDGQQLRRVLPAGWRYQEYEVLGDEHTMAVTALAGPAAGQKDWDERTAVERAFVYDVPSRTIRPLTTLDSLAVRAGKILGAAARDGR